jgi:hypothetical protein
MNGSDYSRFVGDIFGAPLAMEGLLAFFLESTFLRLWIFGWDRLSPRLHPATIWIAAFGSLVSAFFILAAKCVDAAPCGVHIQQGHTLGRVDRLRRRPHQHHARSRLRAHDHRSFPDCGSVQRRVLELPLPADVKRLLVTAQRFGTSPIVRV